MTLKFTNFIFACDTQMLVQLQPYMIKEQYYIFKPFTLIKTIDMIINRKKYFLEITYYFFSFFS